MNPARHDAKAEKPELRYKRKGSDKNKGGTKMRINHNMSAIFANRQLQTVAARMDKSIEKLASGEAINRAGDDASGLAVSERMRTQVRGLMQAEKNAQNGLSFIQVAEGSFQQLNDIMQRIRALAVQSANGIYSASDRSQIQVEVSQLIDEIDRIATSAQFNRMKMLTGRYARDSKIGSMFFHVGPNSNQRIRVYIGTVSSKSLNLIDDAGKKKVNLYCWTGKRNDRVCRSGS
jgi:flagellin